MDSEYDHKFEEMKKYIPFLENMITRLESTSTSSSNPRQAQLDKIRSLRDLLSNKKKRMKMENLLKCEQVLINLYAKVEQRDTLSGVKNSTDSGFSIDTPTPKEKSHLEAVRNKLKTVVKRQENVQDTLPEILPRSEVNDVHTSGTKEPALFQRRPNQPSNQTSKESEGTRTSPQSSSSKRNYTRVLVSPERRWSPTKTPVEKPLFSRRSPRKSPRRYSPSYHKKERKKSRDSQKRKDLNITLNVPEESLNSLNTKDILSRIINCSDGDVDIDTLRELRKQILGELQKTGAKDDISDLILKSYNKSKKNKSKPKLKEEVEEGELSDSESEAIESIYGSLVVKEPGQIKNSTDKDKPRKIQICLVINSDEKSNMPKPDNAAAFPELEMYEKENNEEKKTNVANKVEEPNSTNENPKKEIINLERSELSKENVTEKSKDNVTEKVEKIIKPTTVTNTEINPRLEESVSKSSGKHEPKETTQFKANFYKPLTEHPYSDNSEKEKEVSTSNDSDGTNTSDNVKMSEIESTLEQMEKSPEIPLLNERIVEKLPSDQKTLSEIDILQALKNEILSDITVPGAETTTPLLHQPKIIKIASAQEILPKKRISIEKYKEKSITTPKPISDTILLKDDQTKKPSLKLTDKECERFFNVPKISFDEEDESLGDDDGDILARDVYGDLVPKSPDHDESSNMESAPPVIIPVDPIKAMPVNQKADVDMRTLPLLSPNTSKSPSVFNSIGTSTNKDLALDKIKSENRLDQINNQNHPTLIDPRVRRDLNPNISNQSPNPHGGNNSDKVSRHNLFSGISTSSTPNPVITTNARTYEMTPTHQSFEIDHSSRKHVYVPTVTGFDCREKEKSAAIDGGDRRSRVDDVREACWNPPRENLPQTTRLNESCNMPKNDLYHRSEIPITSTQSFTNQCQASLQSFARADCPSTPVHPFGRLECPPTPSHPFGRLECPPTPSHPFGRLECPPTPNHPFGRNDCPPTPSHPFGRNDCPPTPSHPFGRNDCPPTPSHPFGRMDCPPTPSHPFGRLDCPPTPSHTFGRSDCPSTPSHPFGRTEGPIPLMLNLVDCPTAPSNPFSTADCSGTPTPIFGRNECPPNSNHTFAKAECTPTQNHQFGFHETPQTPGHPFGRSDATKNHYGRSDYNTQKFTKDPRLNRKPESESKSQYDERERGYYKDRDRYRGSSYSSHKSYSDRNYDREQSVGRSRYKYYSPELLSQRQKYKDQEKYDRSFDRSISKDRDRRYTTEGRSHEEVGSRREQGFGRNMRPEDSRLSTRAVCRQDSNETEHNMLSVKPNAGRSFTIDTSVNTTFQKSNYSANDDVFANSFDARRQRAASVGRSLTRESSVGRTLSRIPKSNHNFNENKREAFQRAASVGRDVFDSKSDKRSFQEIKADFKSCKFSTRQFSNKKNEPPTVYTSGETSEYSGRSRKDNYEKEKNEKRGYESSKSYSPRKNYRDPRMRRQFENKNDKNSHSRKSGIIYSNDNIVTGSILKSGYGVRNYKIPKIKRATEEKEEKREVDTTRDTQDKTKDDIMIKEKEFGKEKVNTKEQSTLIETTKYNKTKENQKVTEQAVFVTENNTEEHNNVMKKDINVERRQTRSSKKSMLETKVEPEPVTKPKKGRNVIYDSGSDSESNIKDNSGTKDKSILRSDQPSEHTSPEKGKRKSKKLDPADLDSSFGIDELEMFADNIVSDPVTDDNISALIADLDNDLSTSKIDSGHNFTKEITLENMMQNISSPAKDGLISQVDNDADNSLEQIVNDKVDPLINKNKDNGVHDKLPMHVSGVPNNNEPELGLKDSQSNEKDYDAGLKDPIVNTPTQSDAIHNKELQLPNNLPSNVADKANNEDIDSTTEIEKEVKGTEDISSFDDRNADGCSTPDSTINTDEAFQKSPDEESLPGSTNEVTSTESIEPKPSSSAKDLSPGLDTIGSLLSILQDKTKIKELLNMLGENDKIKKKLEKLSEIVSDDEESSDVSSIKAKSSQKSENELPAVSDNKNTNGKPCIDVKEVDTTEDDQLSRDSSSVLTDKDSKQDDDDTKTSDIEGDTQELDIEIQSNETKVKKKPIKKTKGIKKTKCKLKKITSIAVKRVTRATAAEAKPKIKKPPRELMQLQEDIKEMFIRDEVLSATGIRMCRLAKLVDEKIPGKEETNVAEAGPVVVLEKFKDSVDKSTELEKHKRKKVLPKNKVKTLNESAQDTVKENAMPMPSKNKPGPKSKTKSKKDDDPYAFETDSVNDAIIEKASDEGLSSNSDSESDSIASSKSYGSTELLSDIKKKTKRKRRGWQAGVIKTKAKRKKVEMKQVDPDVTNLTVNSEKTSTPDLNCFTDRNYCFRKNQLYYSCRLCTFNGPDIVLHYRNKHPHVEIPLSRMSPEVAKEAIEQCEEINFKEISKIPSDKYVCTFCFKEFGPSKTVLETFFWHIVSMHTGEYKQTCSKCVNANDCPFNLDIPSPPKDVKGQLIGFICKKCNFTQISVENLKTHVIVRHNDEQTAVYKINLSVMTKKFLNSLLRRNETELIPIQSAEGTENMDEIERVKTRTSARKSNQSVTPPIQSKITFEGDDNSELSDMISETSEMNIKVERIESENNDIINNSEDIPAVEINKNNRLTAENQLSNNQKDSPEPEPSSDIVDYPHFRVNVTESGTKEYYCCCINGNDHFKTTLLISLKKHVQYKHSEKWNGYCYICKVIVTPQGEHRFRECLQHYLDKHIDNFPKLEKEVEHEAVKELDDNRSASLVTPEQASKPYINVRPLSDLLNKDDDAAPQESTTLPIIQSVMSLGSPSLESPLVSPGYAAVGQERQEVEKIYKYEEHQAKVISNKYYLVKQSVMIPGNLIKIFKCSGRYCSFVTDFAEEALAHATTHQRIGGIGALNCSYCDFDSAENAVDLVMHVFKSHGSCQYCCQQCFYRAASSQAVGSHVSRVHGVPPTSGCVLRSKNTPLVPAVKQVMLTREQAVSHYVCTHRDRGDLCKFRTYTPEKLCEHLIQRHPKVPTHSCHLCSKTVVTATDLIQHMKIHGLKLYQCTWCVHGADNESDLLAHVSICHPDKQPQAYIRIITNKGGSSELRVLPLAVLNKYKVSTKDINPLATKEDPVREAERSVEMEALIGPLVNKPSPAKPTETPIQTASELPEQTVETNPDIKPQIIRYSKASDQSSDKNTDDTIETALQSTTAAVVKTEPVESESLLKSIPNVVVLDSDDEDTPAPQQPVIDLSEDEACSSSKNAKFSLGIVDISRLYTCPRCKQVCKNMGGMKKHLYSCAMDMPLIECPHCGQPAENIDKLVWHYVADHSEKNTFECGLCGALLVSENFARKHFKMVHKDSSFIVTPNEKEGQARFTINARKKSIDQPKERVAPKRKLSGPKNDTTPTKRRFEPQEIDQLPINPILEHLVYCSRCEFSTKVRLNMVRHLQLHAEQQPVPQTAPVNPVPHLESNEKHFDKMVNLASSSIVNRTLDKGRTEPTVTLLIPPEAASRYPKYVPERQRHTCGAKGCSYISVDEAMLRCHWETLHSGTSDFHCVHCPPHQHLDTSKPLTATRIISHLKMHDATLYACSSCSYYHFKREALEKHLNEVHKGGRLMVVREEYSAPMSPSPVQSNTAPTMDLKPWQCGLCKFKSMLRPEVVDHCSKFHQSKMQFKCAYCPFRTSAIENISKHQMNSHAGKPEEIFYYYYREGSIPDEADGTPRWVKQRQKSNIAEPEIKVEVSVSPVPKVTPAPVRSPVIVDLNLVKKEVDEGSSTAIEQTIEGLCKIFGQICDPNGIKFKCPLCSVVMEDTREGMQSHLFEELNYRKWSCGLCSYKAFHKAGLTDHMNTEHRRQYDHIELPIDYNIERWVTSVLDHQADVISKHKENLAKQKIVVETNKSGPATEIVVPKEPAATYSDKDLETAFGPLGSANSSMFACPKCSFTSVEEVAMRDHLEMELNKIRWCCSNCPENFQTYHEAQFHCKGHNSSSRPIEAIRNPAMRAAWVTAAIQKQKTVIQNAPTPAHSEPPTSEKFVSDNDNSLLVVRYEERVPTPDLQPHLKRKRPVPNLLPVSNIAPITNVTSSSNLASTSNLPSTQTVAVPPTLVACLTTESDDEKLVIDEPGAKKKPEKQCPYCEYKALYNNAVKLHMLTHFNLKPYSCGYCKYSGYKKTITRHLQLMHANMPLKMTVTELPPEARKIGEVDNLPKLICLVCEKAVPEAALDTHLHNNVRPQFAKDDIVVKCCVCLTLCLDVNALQEHHNNVHPNEPVNYALYKLGYDSRETYQCVYCNNRFKYIKDYRAHHTAVHAEMPFNIKSASFTPPSVDTGDKSLNPGPVVKRCARKSTTKLPNTVAKKSTTKLPHSVPSSSDDEEYSYYGIRPEPLQHYSNVTTLMSFCNKMMPFSLKQLSELLDIEPKVVVTDIKHSSE